MSELEKLTTEIRRATDYQVNKRILREKIQTDLLIPYNGGLFKVSTELLAFLATYRYTTLYIEDTYHNPIEVNRDEFRTLCEEHYQQVMNTWHQQYAELKKIRKV